MSEEQKQGPVKLVHATHMGEAVMAYCARVSNPANQDNPDHEGLLRYCVKNHHWSVFEMASMCLDITTSRGISPQILRHRSFSFQEFSQRYASPQDFTVYEARSQDQKNRQASNDNMPKEVKDWFRSAQKRVWDHSKAMYDESIKLGVAKECARFLLPMNVETRIFMHGTVRSWIHYLQLRTTPGTQLEHREIAISAQRIFTKQFPVVSKSLDWS